MSIFAPRNEALERDLDPEFKRFLLEPGNLRSLRTLLMFNIIPNRIGSNEWPMTDAESTRHKTLSNDHLHLPCKDSDKKTVDLATVIHPDAVIRTDGVIHGIERLLVPRSVQEDFNHRRNLRSISAVLPEGAPEVDPRTNRLKKPATPVSTGLPPVLPIFDAMAPGPSLAPAPGPGGPHHHFDGESQMLVSSVGDESSMVREASMAALKDIAIAGIPFWFWIVAPLFLDDSETWLAKFTKIATSEIISSKELNGVWQRAAAGLLVSIGSHLLDLVSVVDVMDLKRSKGFLYCRAVSLYCVVED
ncbi:hypothetical protein HHK36_009219 [Tetracentron sinense]|uniref:FAS1 domain-containing protein n=1 Tax=Tetracentron sinense TaxID=13715 RepID=A0A834ZD30_TETSI|nr:hypothetical protein HHK36_009219 [Tetracentron sinense]